MIGSRWCGLCLHVAVAFQAHDVPDRETRIGDEVKRHRDKVASLFRSVYPPSPKGEQLLRSSGIGALVRRSGLCPELHDAYLCRSSVASSLGAVIWLPLSPLGAHTWVDILQGELLRYVPQTHQRHSLRAAV